MRWFKCYFCGYWNNTVKGIVLFKNNIIGYLCEYCSFPFDNDQNGNNKTNNNSNNNNNK
jgi:hypothetical protein